MRLAKMGRFEISSDDHQFRQLLHHLGLSWKGYRRVRKGVKKRIRRHMQQLGCQNMPAYLLELDKSKEARRQCEQMVAFPISRFFRDRKLWEVLEKEILPELLSLSTLSYVFKKRA